MLLPPAYRCKLFSICIHVVNRQRFVFIFVFFRALATYIQIKDFMWAAHTHTLTYHLCTHLHINLCACFYVCVYIYLPYYNFVLPFFAAATALLLRWQPQQSPRLTLPRLPLPACVQPRLRSRQRAAHVDVAVAVGVAGKKVLKSAPLCRCDVSLSLTIARLSRDLVLSAESSKNIYFAHPRIFTFDNFFFINLV